MLGLLTLVVGIAQTPPTTPTPVSSGGGTSSGGGGLSNSGPIPIVAKPATLPVQNQAVLRLHALGQVVRGHRSASASSMTVSPEQKPWAEAKGNGAEEVLEKLFATELTYSLTNPNDRIEGHVWLYDANSNLIFHGNAEYIAADVGKGGGPNYNIWMQRIPLLEGALAVEVLSLNEDGVTLDQRWLGKADGGGFLFEQYMAGAPNGLLSARFRDGTVAVYNLWDPKATSPAKLNEGEVQWKIEGHYIVPPTVQNRLSVKIIETWTLPTATITVGAGQEVQFDILGVVQMDGKTAYERPLSLTFTQVDGPWSGNGKLSQDGPTVTGFPAAGKYRVSFEWRNFGKPNSIYFGPVETDCMDCKG